MQRLHLLLLLRSPPLRVITTRKRGRCPAPRLPRPARNGGGGRTHPRPSPSAGTENGSSPKLRSPCPVPEAGQSGAGGRTGVPRSGWRKHGGTEGSGGRGARDPAPRPPRGPLSRAPPLPGDRRGAVLKATQTYERLTEPAAPRLGRSFLPEHLNPGTRTDFLWCLSPPRDGVRRRCPLRRSGRVGASAAERP